MKNKVIDRSKCCNSKVMYQYQTVADILSGVSRDYICNECGKHCEVNTLPAFQEVSKGIYRPINR